MAQYEIIYQRRLLNDKPKALAMTPKHIIDYALSNCFDEKDMWREKVYAIYIGNNNEIDSHQLISVGSTGVSVIDNKLVLKGAIDSLASAVVLFHNHPSGSCLPSKADIQQTHALRGACSALEIKLLDHIILADKEWFSFADEKKYKLQKAAKPSKKIWIRLGGTISADEKTMQEILAGNKDALLKAITNEGFQLDGESYIPELGDIPHDVDFDFTRGEIILKTT